MRETKDQVTVESSTQERRAGASPMMIQYLDIKNAHPDSLLFYRMGDFYEQFHDDAVVSSEVLGISLTSRDKKADQPIPMAGFPWHAADHPLFRHWKQSRVR